MKPSLPWFRIGALLAALSVGAGAFAAHGLDRFFADKYRDAAPKTQAGQSFAASWKYLQDFKTGAEYQMYHAIALMLIGLAARKGATRALNLAGWCFLLGIILFSGSLYILTLTGKTTWGAVTPFGGVLFLVGWGALALGALEARPIHDSH